MESKLPAALLDELAPMLQEELDLTKLATQLTAIEKYRYLLANEKRKLFQTLLQERQRMLLPKTSEYTDLDRKTQQQAAVAVLEADYVFLETMEIVVKERLELGMVLLQTI